MNTDSGVSLDGGMVRTYVPAAAPERAWRIIPAIDKEPRIIALAQQWPGRLLLFATFALLLNFLGANPLITPLAAACAYAGQYRRYLIPLATVLLLYQNGFWIDTGLVARVAEQEGVTGQIDQPLLFAAMLAVVFVFCVVLLLSWHRLRAVSFFRRSTLWLVLLFLGLVVVAQPPFTSGVQRVLLWSFLMTLLPYFWFLAYALADAATQQAAPFWQRLGVFHPFWGSTLTPFGKSVSYLRKFEAKTTEELAVTQLKGVKLAAWTLILAVTLNYLEALIHGYLGVPRFDDAFTGYLAGAGYPPTRLLGKPCRVLCRGTCSTYQSGAASSSPACGWSVFACCAIPIGRWRRGPSPSSGTGIISISRNCWSTTSSIRLFFAISAAIADWRMFFATFTAACIGNLLFHFMRDIHFVAELGWGRALTGEASHALYTFLLATGVAVSQMRQRPSNVDRGWLRGRVLPCAWVALFFCVLHVFDAPLDREHSIWQRGLFLTHILGIDTWT